jgi:hypothetical protein
MPDNGTRIGVLPRYGTADEVRWFEIDPGHVQHFWNGWVEGDRIEFSGTRFAPRVRHRLDPARRARQGHDRPTRRGSGWTSPPAPPGGSRPTTSAATSTASTTTYDGVRSRYHYMSAVFTRATAPRRLRHASSATTTPPASASCGAPGPTGHVGESVFAPDPPGEDDRRGRRLAAQHRPSTYDDATDRDGGAGQSSEPTWCVLDASRRRRSAAPVDPVATPVHRHALPTPFSTAMPFRLPRQLVPRLAHPRHRRSGRCPCRSPVGRTWAR